MILYTEVMSVTKHFPFEMLFLHWKGNQVADVYKEAVNETCTGAICDGAMGTPIILYISFNL